MHVIEFEGLGSDSKVLARWIQRDKCAKIYYHDAHFDHQCLNAHG